MKKKQHFYFFAKQIFWFNAEYWIKESISFKKTLTDPIHKNVHNICVCVCDNIISKTIYTVMLQLFTS